MYGNKTADGALCEAPRTPRYDHLGLEKMAADKMAVAGIARDIPPVAPLAALLQEFDRAVRRVEAARDNVDVRTRAARVQSNQCQPAHAGEPCEARSDIEIEIIALMERIDAVTSHLNAICGELRV